MEAIEMVERLIVATDYDPQKEGGISGVRKKVLKLADNLQGLGVIISVNGILRACGYDLIEKLHKAGFKVMADLKLNDIPNTMAIDGAMLAEYKPELVTVMCSAGIEGMRRVREAVGEATEVLGVTVLTSLSEEECQAIFTCPTKAGVLRFAHMAQLAGLKGLVASPQEVKMLAGRKELALSLNMPGIRPPRFLDPRDDQQRVMAPAEAIQSGADRLIVGRPIIQDGNPRDATIHILEEIQGALSAAA